MLVNSIEVRRANPKDAYKVMAGINAICDEGDAFYTSRFVPTPEWQIVLYHPESAPHYRLFVAEWNGQFAGSGNLFAGGNYTYWQHVASLGLFVLKPFRRLGIGKTIMQHLLHQSEYMGLEKVTLAVFANNVKAINLYQQFGFVEEGRQKKQIKTGTGYTDLILMARFTAR